jgi:transforming growth factor-beta-induced protein
MTFKIQKALSLSLVLAFVVALGSPAISDARGFKPGDQTIAEIALDDLDNFSTLVTALACTGLVGAVADPDAELTVFAPTNAAFAQAGLDETNICSAFDTDTLTTILLYHVVGERRPSPSVINGRNKMITMLAGGSIYPEGKRSLTINANNSVANIVAADILASNGIIHVIDFVLLP